MSENSSRTIRATLRCPPRPFPFVGNHCQFLNPYLTQVSIVNICMLSQPFTADWEITYFMLSLSLSQNFLIMLLDMMAFLVKCFLMGKDGVAVKSIVCDEDRFIAFCTDEILKSFSLGGHKPHRKEEEGEMSFDLNIVHDHPQGERIARTVYQYHYTAWPDHGVPLHALPLITFVR